MMDNQRTGVAPGLIIHGTHDATFSYPDGPGTFRTRRVGVMSVWFGWTGTHRDPQWFMQAVDLDTKKTRDFAMKDMTDVTYT